VVILGYSNLFAKLVAIRRIVVEALVDRGFPDADAQAVALDVVAQIIADLDGFATILDAVDEHAERLEAMALSTYFTQLHDERRRRRDSNPS